MKEINLALLPEVYFLQVTLVYEQVYCTFFDICRDLAFETQSKVLLVILSIFVTVTTPT